MSLSANDHEFPFSVGTIGFYRGKSLSAPRQREKERERDKKGRRSPSARCFARRRVAVRESVYRARGVTRGDYTRINISGRYRDATFHPRSPFKLPATGNLRPNYDRREANNRWEGGKTGRTWKRDLFVETVLSHFPRFPHGGTVCAASTPWRGAPLLPGRAAISLRRALRDARVPRVRVPARERAIWNNINICRGPSCPRSSTVASANYSPFSLYFYGFPR